MNVLTINYVKYKGARVPLLKTIEGKVTLNAEIYA